MVQGPGKRELMSPAFSLQRMRLYLELYFMCVELIAAFQRREKKVDEAGILLHFTPSSTSPHYASEDFHLISYWL